MVGAEPAGSMDRAHSITAVAVTTAGVLLALASIHGSVGCSVMDILEGQATSRRKGSSLIAGFDDEDDDNIAAFLAVKAQMDESAAAAAALYGEGLLTDLELFGMNFGQWYIKPRSLTWFDTFVQTVYDDERWKKLFRVGRATFMYLVDSLHARLQQAPPRSLARSIPTRHLTVVKQLAVALYKLGHGVSNFGVGELFGLGESTVSSVVWRVSQAIVEIEAPRRIHWPEAGEERAAAIAQMQAVHGIPNCIGAIDCTHVSHDAPAGYLTTDFYDRDHNFSTVVQLVGNQQHRILNVNVGYPGVVHDTRVLQNSALYKTPEAFFGPPAVNVNGIEVPQLLVADAGYPMEPWLLTPYPGHHLNPTQASFNFKHSSTRMCIEQINGELKGVQRFLLTKIQKPKIERLPIYIAACCTLHNLRIDMGDVMERAYGEWAAIEEEDMLGNVVMEATGESNYDQATDIRNAVAEYLAEDRLVRQH